MFAKKNLANLKFRKKVTLKYQFFYFLKKYFAVNLKVLSVYQIQKY